LGVPARVARPRNVIGLVDSLQTPAFATSVGLLQWAFNGHTLYRPKARPAPRLGSGFRTLVDRLLPG
jgi:cell division protein FtsA